MSWGVLAFTAAPGQAASVSYCVPDTTFAGCPSGSTAEPTIAAALSASKTAGGHNAIHLAQQTFTESYLDDLSGNQVDLIGSGPGTTVTAPPGPYDTVLSIDDPSSTVSNLHILVPSGNGKGGMGLCGSASDITVTSAPGAKGARGVWLCPNGSLTASSITLPADARGASGGTVSDTSITAGTGGGAGTYIHDRIVATIGVDMRVTDGPFTSVIDDTLIRTVPGSQAEGGVLASAVGYYDTTSSTVTMRHDTVIGDGAPGSTGISCSTGVLSLVDAGATCTENVDSTIVRGFSLALSREAQGHNSTPSAANISIDYSDFDPAAVVDGGNISGGTGSINQGPHNVNADPSFESTDPSNPLAFQLSGASQLIDIGDPALGAGEPNTDLAGAPRVVAGRSGDPARSDIGAYEFQPMVANTDPATSVAATSAVLNGTTNAPSSNSDYYFEYGTSTSYGSKTPTTPIGTGTQQVSAPVSSLSEGLTYHFRLVVVDNSTGPPTVYHGVDLTFTPMVAMTSPATSVTSSSAVLNALTNAPSSDSEYYFEYGTSTSYGSNTPTTPIGTGTQQVSAPVSNLRPGVTYHFRIVVVDNSAGPPAVYPGDDRIFTTPGSSGGAFKTPTTAARTHASGKLGLGKRKLKVRHHKVSISLHCAGDPGATCRGTWRITLRTSGGKRMSCARGHFSLSAGDRKTVKTRLTRKCLRLLGSANNRKLRADFRATVDGQSTQLRRSVRLFE